MTALLAWRTLRGVVAAGGQRGGRARVRRLSSCGGSPDRGAPWRLAGSLADGGGSSWRRGRALAAFGDDRAISVTWLQEGSHPLICRVLPTTLKNA